MPLEQIGNAVIFYAHYVKTGVSVTGLTVTADVWKVKTDGTATEIASAQAATEIGDGLYRYRVAGASIDVEGEYLCVFKTAGDVDQQHMVAMWTVGRAGIENLDTPLTTIDSDVWMYAERTLTSGSTAPGTGLAAEVWTVLRGDALSRTFATIAADGSITKCQLTVKLHSGLQPDTDAILAVDSVTGLIVLNGVTPEGTYTASFTLPDGILSIPAVTMAQLEAPEQWEYDVQVWRGGAVETIELGQFAVTADVTRVVTGV